MKKRPSILLVEDHELVAEGLVAMLGGSYDVVATVAKGADVPSAVREHDPDLVLLDLSLPDRNGIDLLPELRSEHPDIRVLILTMHVDVYLVETAMKLGACGFVPKNATIEELKEAIAEVLAGRKHLSPKLPKYTHRTGLTEPMGFSQLTERQRRIVRMIAKGLTSEEIAAELKLTVWTVAFHRKNIRRALGIHSDLEMYRYAILVGPDEEGEPTP